jgi:hypothetical protein
LGEGEIGSQADAQAHDVSISTSQDCSGSTGEMGEGESDAKEGLNTSGILL